LGRSHFTETGFANVNQMADRRGSDIPNIEAFTGNKFGCSASGCDPARGNFIAEGVGFFEPTVSKSKRADFNLSKTQRFCGEHTLGIGYTFQRGNYDGTRDNSGPKITIPNLPINSIAAGLPANASFRLRFRKSTSGGVLPLFPLLLSNGTTAL